MIENDDDNLLGFAWRRRRKKKKLRDYNGMIT